MKARKGAVDAAAVDGVPVMFPDPATPPVSIVPVEVVAQAAPAVGAPALAPEESALAVPEPAPEPTPRPVAAIVPQPRPAPPAYLWEAALGVASGGAYRSARPRAFIVVVLLALAAVSALASAGHRIVEILALDRFVEAPRTISGVAGFDAQGTSLDRLALTLAGLVFLSLIAWVARSIDNLGPLALAMPTPPASPRWSIAWWLIPFANLLMPFVVVHDLYRRVAGGRRAWIVLGAWGLMLLGIAIVGAALTRGPRASSVVDLGLTVGSVSGAVAIVGRQVSLGAIAIGEIVLALAAVIGLVTVRRIQAGAGRRARACAAYAAELAEEAGDAPVSVPLAADREPAGVPLIAAVPVAVGDDSLTEPLALPTGASPLAAAHAAVQVGEPVEKAAATVAN
jgi:Domain of unknown function (DUF4328)